VSRYLLGLLVAAGCSRSVEIGPPLAPAAVEPRPPSIPAPRPEAGCADDAALIEQVQGYDRALMDWAAARNGWTRITRISWDRTAQLLPGRAWLAVEVAPCHTPAPYFVDRNATVFRIWWSPVCGHTTKVPICSLAAEGCGHDPGPGMQTFYLDVPSGAVLVKQEAMLVPTVTECFVLDPQSIRWPL
jgi:hypothetical protein